VEVWSRNLLEVSRRTRIPFTSVYHRVAKLEEKSKRLVYLIPQLSKLGMIRVVILVTASPGSEERVTTALKIPNLWRSINPCEGTFTHLSVHAVPVKFLRQIKTYVKRLSEVGLIRQSRIILTGEYIPNFPNFRYYDAASNKWTFQWERWLFALKNAPSRAIEDPESYDLLVSRKDVLIVKELEKNARLSFADIAPVLGISLQGVKYHYDKKLIPTGIVKYFAYDILPYPEEVSAYHEILLEFTSNLAMKRFFHLVDDLFFVLGVAKVLNRNSLLVRTLTLQTQLSNMFAFFSQMARDGALESYSAVRQDFNGRQRQTISYELLDDKMGWQFDLKKCLSELSRSVRAVQIHQKHMVPRAGLSQVHS
jgi:DNA-binding Lrp family transcriptional regulator